MTTALCILAYFVVGFLIWFVAVLATDDPIPFALAFFLWPIVVILGGIAVVCILTDSGLNALAESIDNWKFKRSRRRG